MKGYITWIPSPLRNCLPKQPVHDGIIGVHPGYLSCIPHFISWIHESHFLIWKHWLKVDLGPISIISVKPKYPNELSEFGFVVASFSHPENGSLITYASKIDSGIKISNDLFVLIFLKSHECLDVFILTFTHDFLK